jgi:Leucine-rich repeat (LRR) protein
MSVWKIEEYTIWVESGCPIEPNVVELDLSSNNLTRLSEKIGHLRNLRKINIENNHIKQIPVGIVALQIFSQVISGNPLIQAYSITCENICKARKTLETCMKHQSIVT